VAYPITYAADFVEDRSRLTTFFRYILAIPHFFVAGAFGIVAAFAVIIAWFSIVFTGRYPEGLYGFNAGFVRYVARISGYISLLTDSYPPFSLGEAPDYPVHLSVGPPLPQYDRLKTGLRIIFAIPVYVIAYALQIVQMVASVIAWFWILITGKQNDGLQSAINLGLSYNVKAIGYYFLLTETWPPFSDSGEQLPAGDAPSGTLAPPMAPPPSAPEAPQALQAPDLKGSDIGLSDGDPLG